MKKKWTPVPQDWWDPAAIEQWLEDEAKKGWRVASCNGWFAKLEKAEPKECRVRIQFQGPMEKKAWEERIDAYEELGWEFATAHGQDYEIFYCDDPAAPEPDTDEAVYAMAWKTPLRRSWWSGWAFLLLPLVVLIWMCSLEGSLLRTLLRSGFRVLYYIFLLGPMFAFWGARQLWRVSRARKALEAGLKPTGGNWKRSRRWGQTVCVVLLGFLFVAPIADVIWAANIPDPDGIAMIRPAEPGEAEAEDWEFDWHGYAYQSAPLCPLRYDMRFCREGQAVENSWNLLSMDCMAKMLYREKRAEFLADHPDAAEEPIENPVFDEALLLTGGENVQMLLVCSGKTVYSLWVDYPAEIHAYIDAVAARMAKLNGGTA